MGTRRRVKHQRFTGEGDNQDDRQPNLVGRLVLSAHHLELDYISLRFTFTPQQFPAQSTPLVMADSVKEGPAVDEERTKNRKRFELELEFVQALANPFYLHSLAQQGILYQPAFVNYLKYLLYWKEKEYARFIL